MTRRPSTGPSSADVVAAWRNAERLIAYAETRTTDGVIAARLIRPAGASEPVWQIADGRLAEESADGNRSGGFRTLKLPAPPRTMALAAGGVCACVWARPGAETGGLAISDAGTLTILLDEDVRPSAVVAYADSHFAALCDDGIVLLRRTASGWAREVVPGPDDVPLGSSRLLTDMTPGARGIVLMTARGGVSSWRSEDGVTWCQTSACLAEQAQQVRATGLGLISWGAVSPLLTLSMWSGDSVQLRLPAGVGIHHLRGANAGRTSDGCRIVLRLIADGRERHISTLVPASPFDEPHWSQLERRDCASAPEWTCWEPEWETVWQGAVGERAHHWGVARQVLSESPLRPGTSVVESMAAPQHVATLPPLTAWVNSAPRDSVRIPLQCAGDATLQRAPILLTVYGGFGVVNELETGPTTAAWAAMGGWTVAAGVRGGGEGGRVWHEAGAGRNKLTSVADCVAVVRHFAQEGHRVVALGASHGGWLAAMTALVCPQLLAGVVLTSPLLDLRDPYRHGYGRLWLTEFGLDDRGAADNAGAAWRTAISPLAQLEAREAGALPPMLVFSPEWDARVNPDDARDWVRECGRLGGEATLRTLPAGHANAGLETADARLLETLDTAARWCAPG